MAIYSCYFQCGCFPLPFGASSDGCVHCSSNVSASSAPPGWEDASLGHKHLSPQNTPHSTLRDKSAFAQTWGVTECNSQVTILCSMLLCSERGSSNEVLKVKSLSCCFLAVAGWMQQIPNSLVPGFWLWTVKVNQQKSRKQNFPERFLSSLCYLLCSWDTRLQANKAQSRIIWFITFAKV